MRGLASIEVRRLGKTFGNSVAVDELSFQVAPGQVTGFVGPNGAGKSTTMRIILGLDRPTAGEALIAGRPYHSISRPLCQVGALLEANAVHPGRRGRDHLLWLAQSNGLPSRRVDQVIEQVGLGAAAWRRAGGYSRGMCQRLGLAAALLGDPGVLILDEPVNGLDPEGVRWMRQSLRDWAGQGKAVLVSSHLIAELEGTADRLLVIGHGRLLADSSVAELVGAINASQVDLRTTQRERAITALTGAGAQVTLTGPDSLSIEHLPAERVAQVMATHGLPVLELTSHRATLEDAYLKLTQGVTQHRSGETS